jgi:WD40 repeat protein
MSNKCVVNMERTCILYLFLRQVLTNRIYVISGENATQNTSITHTHTHTHTSHTSSCVCVCVCVIQVMTNKGRFVVTASDDCTARVWDLHADMSTHAVDCHTSRIRAVSDAARWW